MILGKLKYLYALYWRHFIAEDGIRPRDWQPRRSSYKVPLRLMRLCLLGMLLPFAFIAGPLYLRYRVYSEQLYALAVSDQRLIDNKVSTLWCQVRHFAINILFLLFFFLKIRQNFIKKFRKIFKLNLKKCNLCHFVILLQLFLFLLSFFSMIKLIKNKDGKAIIVCRAK